MSTRVFRVAVRQFAPFESAIRKQWESFVISTGHDLELEAKSLDLHDLHKTLFEEEGLLNGFWDIAFVPTDWIAEAHETGALIDLTPYISIQPPEDYPAAWSDSLLRFQRFGDQTLGLPYHDGPECLIYRTDLFEELNLSVPSTWSEFRETARSISKRKLGIAGAIFAGYPDGHNTVYDFCLQLWTRGGDLFDEQERLRLCTPQAEAALTFYREIFQDAQAVHPRVRELDSVAAGWAFAKGEGGMTVNWFGFAAMCESVAASLVKGRVNVASLPVEPAGLPSASLNVYWMLGVGSGSKLREIGYEFLRHCASAENDRMLTLEGAIGCRKSTWRDPEVNRVIPFYHELERLHENARELPRLARFPKVAALLDRLMCTTCESSEPVDELLARFQTEARTQDL
jgi:multiple sugar transport system substrate-binding protein